MLNLLLKDSDGENDSSMIRVNKLSFGGLIYIIVNMNEEEKINICDYFTSIQKFEIFKTILNVGRKLRNVSHHHDNLLNLKCSPYEYLNKKEDKKEIIKYLELKFNRPFSVKAINLGNSLRILEMALEEKHIFNEIKTELKHIESKSLRESLIKKCGF